MKEFQVGWFPVERCVLIRGGPSINERQLEVLTFSAHNCNFFLQTTVTCTQHWLDICKRSMMEFVKCVMFLHYISDEKIKTTRDQVTTQS